MKKSVVLSLLLLVFSAPVFSQSTSWRGTLSNAWHISANWTNGVPDSGKHAVLGDANFTGGFQPRISVASACRSLTVGSTVPVTLTLARNLNVAGDMSIAATGTVLLASASITLSGDWSNNGIFRATASGSRVVFAGANQRINGNTVTIFRRLTVNAGCTMTLDQHAIVDSAGALLDISGTINPGISPAYRITSTGATRVNATARLLVYAPTFTGNYLLTGRTSLSPGSVVEYASAITDQQISSSYSYSTLILSGGTRKFLSANLPQLYGRAAQHGVIEIRNATFDLAGFTANRANTVAGGQLIVFPGSSIRLSGLNNFPSNYLTRDLQSGSTVEYYGADQTISPQSYANLTISGTGNKNALTSSTINGHWVLNSSNWNTGTASVTHSFSGNMTMNGGTISGTNATYRFAGAVDQDINLTDTLQRVLVNKASGKVILQNDLVIGNNLQFTSGNIQTGNNRLRMTASATVTGASQSTGWVEGFMARSFPSGSSVVRTFEIGSSAYYAPLTLQVASVVSAGQVEASSTGSEHSEIDYSGIDDTKSVNRFWTITNLSAVFTSYNLTFNWETADRDGAADPMLFRPGFYNGSVWTIFSANSPGSNAVTANGLAVFGQFAVGEKLGRSTWHGNFMTADWFTPKNWRGGVPATDQDALIPSGLSGGRLYPQLTGSTGSVRNIEVEPGATLEINNGTLQIAGTITNNGLLQASDGTVEFNGTTPQGIPNGAFTGNTIKNLIVSNDLSLSGTDTITGKVQVAAGKTFNTNNYLVLKSTATGTARIDQLPVDGSGNATAFINGEVSIERFIPARRAWRLLSAPIANGNSVTINQAWQEGSTNQSFGPGDPNPGYGVHITGGTNANGFDQSPTNLPSVRVYNPASNGFIGLPANPGTYAAIGNYTGYMVYIRGDRGINLMDGVNAAITKTTLRVKGTVNTGNKTYPVNAAGFTVLGNPYPSAIDFQTLTRTNVRNTFYIWDPRLAGSQGLGGYVTASWNSNTNSYDFTASASPVSQYIPSGEAVLIQSDDGINPGSITIKESDKTENGSDQWFGRQSSVDNKVNIRLFAADDENMLDAALLTFEANGKNAYDQHDALKFPTEIESISLLATGKLLAIERRAPASAGDTISIHIANLKPGAYRVELEHIKWLPGSLKAFIVDRYLNRVSALNDGAGNGWTFVVDDESASADADRFYIILAENEPVTRPVYAATARPEQPTPFVKPASMMVYPNPVTGNSIGLISDGLREGYYQASLVNGSGTVVWRARIYMQISKGRTQQIDIDRDIPPGRYELILESSSARVSTGLIRQ